VDLKLRRKAEDLATLFSSKLQRLLLKFLQREVLHLFQSISKLLISRLMPTSMRWKASKFKRWITISCTRLVNKLGILKSLFSSQIISRKILSSNITSKTFGVKIKVIQVRLTTATSANSTMMVAQRKHKWMISSWTFRLKLFLMLILRYISRTNLSSMAKNLRTMLAKVVFMKETKRTSLEQRQRKQVSR